MKNDNAIYGFTPDPNSQSIGSFYESIDWTNPEQVAAARAKRIDYHKENENIYNRLAEMKSQNACIEEMAKEGVNMRNQNRLHSYVGNPEGLQAAREHNMNVYGNPNGPTPESLFAKYGS